MLIKKACNYFIFSIFFSVDEPCIKCWFDVTTIQMSIFILFENDSISFEGAFSLWSTRPKTLRNVFEILFLLYCISVNRKTFYNCLWFLLIVFAWKAKHVVFAVFLHLLFPPYDFSGISGNSEQRKHFTVHWTANQILVFAAVKGTFSGLFFL